MTNQLHRHTDGISMHQMYRRSTRAPCSFRILHQINRGGIFGRKHQQRAQHQSKVFIGARKFITLNKLYDNFQTKWNGIKLLCSNNHMFRVFLFDCGAFVVVVVIAALLCRHYQFQLQMNHLRCHCTHTFSRLMTHLSAFFFCETE